MIQIRNENEKDYREVEKITRKSFWNLYVPGCNEHYFVHVMRSHKDFIPELDFVIEVDQQIIGNIMYTKATLIDESGTKKDILTFGPLCILPEYQRQGYGKKLLEHSFKEAAALDYDVIVIFGSPSNYVSRGFKSCQKYNVCLENGTYPSAMMVKELKPNALDGRKWIYYQSPVLEIDEQEAERFDQNFEPLAKTYQPSQEEFYIYSRSAVQATSLVENP